MGLGDRGEMGLGERGTWRQGGNGCWGLEESELSNPQSPSPPLGGRGVNESRINELSNHE